MRCEWHLEICGGLPMKTANLYLSTDDEGKLLNWSAYIRDGSITVGVTKDTLIPEVYAEGWPAYYDDLTERGYAVDIFYTTGES